MGLISGGMVIASCVVNDYFDLKIDASNAPGKPLPSGFNEFRVFGFACGHFSWSMLCGQWLL
jgi:4-hydroxybenzoate polyprenyltransferase